VNIYRSERARTANSIAACNGLMFGGIWHALFYRQFKKDLRANSRAVNKLRVAVETCKRVLSTVGAAQCSVDSLYEGIDFNSTLSRS